MPPLRLPSANKRISRDGAGRRQLQLHLAHLISTLSQSYSPYLVTLARSPPLLLALAPPASPSKTPAWTLFPTQRTPHARMIPATKSDAEELAQLLTRSKFGKGMGVHITPYASDPIPEPNDRGGRNGNNWRMVCSAVVQDGESLRRWSWQGDGRPRWEDGTRCTVGKVGGERDTVRGRERIEQGGEG